MAEIEPAFTGVGQAAGIETWRIEKLKPVKQPKTNGKFYTGDSYILLVTTVDKNNKKSYKIHFWLGNETSQDESGVAAYKTVELDDSLGGSAQQFREIQGNESALFLSYFKSTGGIEYLPGGIESGFRKVERDVYQPRLLWLKGARTVRVTEVPLSNKSLNKGDVFILDLGLEIYIFNGPLSNRKEKSKGVEVASRIDSDERSGRAHIIHLEDDIQNSVFWDTLGGYINPDHLPAGESDDIVKDIKITPTLYKLVSGEFVSVTLPGGKLEKDLLTSEDIFLVHASKIYLWIGSGAELTAKREATANGVKYIKNNGLPASTALERISQGVETNSFKAEFTKWEVVVNLKSGVASMQADQNIDVAALLAKKAEEDKPFDDGSGNLDIWVVNDFQLVDVHPSKYGQFYGGDSYVILYTYIKNKKTEYVIYFWLGDKSSTDEKGAAALLTKEKSDALGGRITQIRVTQGKEPAHFRQLFKGNSIVHAGGKASGFNRIGGQQDNDSYDTDGVALFRIKGSNPLNCQAVQVSEIASELNGEDCFVLVTPPAVYVWAGNGSNSEEQATALSVGSILANDYNGSSGRVIEQLSEGQEPAAFWEALGGHSDYPAVAPGEPLPKDSRLFTCSNATGSFKVEEVFDFEQEDLVEEDVMLLDTFTTLFVWIGSQANDSEKTKSVAFANKYIADANDGRDPNCPVILVYSGQEPHLFTCKFIVWDHALAAQNQFSDPYQAKLNALQKTKGVTASAPPSGVSSLKPTSAVASSPAPASASSGPSWANKNSATLSPTAAKLYGAEAAPASAPTPVPASSKTSVTSFASFEDVKAGNVPGMDFANRELYLDDETFKAKLGMDKAAFAALPKWKRDAKKKELGIF